MKYLFLPVILMSFTASALDFDGAALKPVEVKAEASSGLDAIYVIAEPRGVSMVYTAASATSPVRWLRYSRMGASYAEEVTPQREGARLTLPCATEDMGYVIEEGGRSRYYWVINYAGHRLDLKSISFAAEQDCDRTHFDFTGSAGELEAYSPLGRRIIVSRDLEISYTSLAFNDESFAYSPVQLSDVLGSVSSTFSVGAPLANTSFTLSGDRFLKAWGQTQTIESDTYATRRVEAQTRATQEQRDADNEQRVEGGELGGSAPCDITFEAAVSDAAVFNEWQISRSPDFSEIINSYNDQVFSYTFTEQGKTYVRFISDNADGTCPFESQTYEIFIGESKFDIPNAFSPGTSPGVNDEWKVSYKSIVSYKCTIFNRWGKKLFESDDPSVGWDGKTGGKVVPPGVYFYVIKAVGADGVKYDKAGDINIIGFKNNSNNSSNQETE